jgi:hypothetical protein
LRILNNWKGLANLSARLHELKISLEEEAAAARSGGNDRGQPGGRTGDRDCACADFDAPGIARAYRRCRRIALTTFATRSKRS